MGSIATIVIHSDDAPGKLAQDIIRPNGNPRIGLNKASSYLAAMAGGVKSGKVQVYIEDDDGTAASGTVACAVASIAADDTVTIAGVVFTVKASPSSDPSDGEFAEGSTDTECGDNLAAAINAHPKLKGLVTAANASGTVTVTAGTKGVWGNQITLAETGTGFTISGARLASGAVGTVQEQARTYLAGTT